MSNNKSNQETTHKQWTTADRWYFGGNLLLSIGTLCISIAHLVQLANNGRISEFTAPSACNGRYGPSMTIRDDDISPSTYFRR